MWTRVQPRNEERFDEFVRAPGTHAAVAVLIANICALTVEAHGFMLFVLAGTAAATVAYLGARLFHESPSGVMRALRRRR